MPILVMLSNFTLNHIVIMLRFILCCAASRGFCQKGEKLDVEIEVPDKAFTTVSDIGERKQFAKEFTLYVGTHQPDELSCQLSGTNCMSIEIER